MNNANDNTMGTEPKSLSNDDTKGLKGLNRTICSDSGFDYYGSTTRAPIGDLFNDPQCGYDSQHDNDTDSSTEHRFTDEDVMLFDMGRRKFTPGQQGCNCGEYTPYFTERVTQTRYKKFEPVILNSPSTIEPWTVVEGDITQYDMCVCCPSQKPEFPIDKFGAVDVFAPMGVYGGTTLKDESIGESIDVVRHVSTLRYRDCKHSPSHYRRIETLGLLSFEQDRKNIFCFMGNTVVGKIHKFADSDKMKITGRKLVAHAATYHPKFMQNPDVPPPKIPDLSQYYSVGHDGKTCDYLDWSQEFSTVPSLYCQHVFGRRLNVKPFYIPPSQREFCSYLRIVQDAAGTPYVAKSSEPMKIYMNNSVNSRNLLEMIASFSFPCLKMHEFPRSLGDAVCLYFQLYFRGSISAIGLSTLLPTCNLECTLEHVPTRIHSRNNAVRMRHQAILEGSLSGCKPLIWAASLSSMITTTLAAAAFPENASAKRDWLGIFIQLIMLMFMWRNFEKKKLDDPLSCAFKMAKMAFLDPEQGMMKSNMNEVETVDDDSVEDPLAQPDDSGYVGYVPSDPDAAMRYEMLKTARKQALEVLKAKFSDVAQNHAKYYEKQFDVGLEYASSAVAYNGKTIGECTAGEVFVQACVDIPSFWDVLKPVMTEEVISTLEEILFHTSTVASIYLAGQSSNSRKMRLAIVTGWLALYSRKIYNAGMRLQFFNKEHLQSNGFEDTLSEIEKVFSSYNLMKHSPIMGSVKKMFAKVVSVAALPGVSGDHSELVGKMSEYLEKFMVGESFAEALIGLIVKCLHLAHAMRNGVSFEDAICTSDWNDVAYLECNKMMMNLEFEEDKQYVMSKLTQLEESCEYVVKTAKNPTMRAVATTRHAKVCQWKKKWRSVVTVGQPKPQPFVITICGPAGVGKTSMLKNLSTVLHSLRRKFKGPIIERVGSQDTMDKFDSNLDSATTLVIIDDMAFNDSDTYDYPPSSIIERYVGSTVRTFLKSESAEKGVELNLSEFTLVTTNKHTAGCDWKTTDPEAGFRRLGLKIEIQLKPEYRHPVTGKPMSHKFPPDLGGLGPHCTYRPYELVNMKPQYTDVMPYDSEMMMQYITLKYMEHLAAQKRQSNYVREYCNECCLPLGNGCSCREEISNIGEGQGFDTALRLLRVYSWVLSTGYFHIFANWVLPHSENRRYANSWGFFSPVVYYFCYVCSWFSWVIFSRLHVVERLNDRLNDRCANMQALLTGVGKSAAAGLLTYSIYQLWKNRRIMTPIVSEMFSNLLEGEPGLTIDEKKKMMQEEKPWAVVNRKTLPRTPYQCSTTLDMLFRHVMKNLCQITLHSRSGANCYGLFAKTCYLMTPGHMWKEGETTHNIDLRFREFRTKQVTVYRSHTYFVPNRDVAITFVGALAGDRHDLTKYFSVCDPGINHHINAILRLDDVPDSTGKLVNPMHKTVVVDANVYDLSEAKGVKCYRYSAPWLKGQCMLPLLYGDERSAMICGFHIGFQSGSQICAATNVTVNEWEEAKKWFLQAPDILQTTQKTALNVVEGFERNVSDEPHPANIINFIPADIIPEVDFYGDIGKSFTPKTETKFHPLKDEFEKEFVLSDIAPVKMSNAPLREVATLGCANEHVLNDAALAKSLADYKARLFLVVDKVKEFKKESPLFFGAFNTTEGPYTVEEVLNGKQDNIVRTGIKPNASAGEPFRMKKARLLEGEKPDYCLIPEVVASLHDCTERLKMGQHSGTIMRMSAKDEGRPPDKVHAARIFQAPGFELHLVMSMMFGPLMDAIVLFPSTACCAVGVSSHGYTWGTTVGFVLQQFEHVLEFDVSKFDMTIPTQLRIGVGKVVVEATMRLMERYDSDFQSLLEHIMWDVISPLCSINGAVVEMTGLWPSGIPLTAHMGAMMGRVLLGYSYYLNGFEDFNEHVVSQGLGDDIIASTDVEGWNQFTIAKDYAAIGMKITSGSKKKIETEYVNKEDAVFLKRVTRWCPEKQHLVGQLDPDSIFKPVTTIIYSKSITLSEQICDQCTSLTLECLMHGRAAYNLVISRVRDVLRRNGYPITDLLAMDFDERMEAHFTLLADELGFDFVPQTSDFPTTDEPSGLMDRVKMLSNMGEVTEGITVLPVEGETSISEQSENMSPLFDFQPGASALSVDREYLLTSLDIPIGSAVVQEFQLFDIWDLPYVKNRFANIHGVHCDFEVRFLLSGSTAHYGSLMCSVMPMSRRLDFQVELSLDQTLLTALDSSRDHVLLGVGESENNALLICPLIVPFPTITPYLQQTGVYSPTIRVSTVVPFRHVYGLSKSVTLHIFVRMLNLKTTGSTSMVPMTSNVAEVNEKTSGTLAVAGNAIKAAALAFRGLPRLSLIAEVVGDGVLVGSDILRRFGYSRPLEFGQNCSVVSCSPSLALTDTNVIGKKLSLFHDQGVAVANVLRAQDEDPLSHSSMLKRWTIVKVFKWTSEDAAGAAIGMIGVSPYINVQSNGKIAISPSCLVASQYLNWHGAVWVNIKVVAPEAFGGKLIMHYEPESDALVPNLSTATNQSWIMDLKLDKDKSIKVGWGSNYYALRTTPKAALDVTLGPNKGYTNGTLFFSVLTPLTVMGDQLQEVGIVVQMRADEKMLFFDHFNNLGHLKVYNVDNTTNAANPTTDTNSRNLTGIPLVPGTFSPIDEITPTPPPNWELILKPRVPPSIPPIDLPDCPPCNDDVSRAPFGPNNPAMSASSAPVSKPETAMPVVAPSIFSTLFPTKAPVAPTLTPVAPTTAPVAVSASTNTPTILQVESVMPSQTDSNMCPVVSAAGLQSDVDNVYGGSGSFMVNNGEAYWEFPAKPSILTPGTMKFLGPTVPRSGAFNGYAYDTSFQFVLTLSAPIQLGLAGNGNFQKFYGNTPKDYQYVGLASYIRNETKMGGIMEYTIDYLADTSFRVVSFLIDQHIGMTNAYFTPAELFAVNNVGILLPFTLPSGGQIQALKLTAGQEITVPTVADCHGGRRFTWMFRGSGKFANSRATAWNHNTYMTGYRVVNVNEVTFRSDGDSWIAGLSTMKPLLTSNMAEVQDWQVASPTQEENVCRLCAGEYPSSLRSLLKYFSPLPSYAGSSWNESPLYEFDAKAADLRQLVFLSHVGVRGSVNVCYSAQPRLQDNVTVYVAKGASNFNLNCDNLLKRGFEYFTTRHSSSMVINHPYYSCESFHSVRAHIYTPAQGEDVASISGNWPTVERQNMVTRLWCAYSEAEMNIIDEAVTQSLSVGEDFSVMEFLGVPILELAECDSI